MEELDRQILIKNFLVQNGLKASWLAKKLETTEENLSYHIKKGFKNKEISDRFFEIVRNHSINILKNIQQLEIDIGKCKD